MAALVFGYVTWFRLSGVSSHFMLLDDQIRDWGVALGPVWDQPLAGAPSMAGGRGLGPVYYWVLWIARVAIGPWVDNLPHAGGIGISLLQGAAGQPDDHRGHREQGARMGLHRQPGDRYRRDQGQP